jgi:hypothetical protein
VSVLLSRSYLVVAIRQTLFKGSRSVITIKYVLVSNLGPKRTYFEFFYNNTRLAS